MRRLARRLAHKQIRKLAHRLIPRLARRLARRAAHQPAFSLITLHGVDVQVQGLDGLDLPNERPDSLANKSLDLGLGLDLLKTLPEMLHIGDREEDEGASADGSNSSSTFYIDCRPPVTTGVKGEAKGGAEGETNNERKEK
ncbi:hypothetical protein ACS0PU_012507 [Formica fusca]